MRRSLLLLVALQLISWAAHAQETPLHTTSRLRLRSQPSRQATTVQIAPRGSEVVLLDTVAVDSFYRVRVDQSTEGWMFGTYLGVPDEVVSMASASTSRPLCGDQAHYRWKEKATSSGLDDPEHSISVTGMLAWPALPFHGSSIVSWCQGREGRENTVYRLTGWVRRVRAEADGDVHIEVTSTAHSPVARCVVVEIPPESYSPRFKQARDDLKVVLGITSLSNHDLAQPVRAMFTGLAFWDGWHVTTGLPTNHGRCNSTKGAAWELHPVFKVASP
jgi:hypothetical protein